MFDIKSGDKGKSTHSPGRTETLAIQQLGDNNENKDKGIQSGREVANQPYFKLLITSCSKAYSTPAVTKCNKNALAICFNELFLQAANFQFIEQVLNSIE